MRHNYLFTAIGLTFVYWILDSSIHWYIYGEELEVIPHEPNELWMRGMIAGLLILFGAYADYQTKRLIDKEEEKRRIFRATVFSTQHILNNLLNQLILFQLEMDKSDAFSDEIKNLYRDTLQAGKQQVIKLSAVNEITEESIKNTIESE